MPGGVALIFSTQENTSNFSYRSLQDQDMLMDHLNGTGSATVSVTTDNTVVVIDGFNEA